MQDPTRTALINALGALCEHLHNAGLEHAYNVAEAAEKVLRYEGMDDASADRKRLNELREHIRTLMRSV